VYVFEGYYVFVFVDFVSRDVSGHYFAKDTVSHVVH